MSIQTENHLTDNLNGTSAERSDARAPRRVVVFVGSNVVFSDRLLDLVEDQFDAIDVVNLTATTNLTQMDPALRSAVCLIIVDETAIKDFAALRATASQFADDVKFAIAYRTLGIAAAIYRKAHQAEEKWDLGFLPMSIELEAWLASLRLLMLSQDFVPSEVLTAEVARKEDLPCFSDRAQSKTALEQDHRPVQNDFAKLTNRETQILELISKGHRNRAIAQDLGLSVHTVKLHVHNIFGKLGVNNRTSATTKYLSRGRL